MTSSRKGGLAQVLSAYGLIALQNGHVQLNEAEWRIYASVNWPSIVQMMAYRLVGLVGAKPLSDYYVVSKMATILSRLWFVNLIIQSIRATCLWLRLWKPRLVKYIWPYYWPSVRVDPPVIGRLTSQRGSNVESVSMPWCHHIPISKLPSLIAAGRIFIKQFSERCGATFSGSIMGLQPKKSLGYTEMTYWSHRRHSGWRRYKIYRSLLGRYKVLYWIWKNKWSHKNICRFH